MSQASRYVETRRLPFSQVPSDVLESMQNAKTIPIPGEKHLGALFSDGSTACKINERWIVTDELGVRDLTDAQP